DELRARIEAKIRAPDFHWRTIRITGRDDGSTVGGARYRDVIIQTPDGIIDHRLHVELPEAGEDFPFLIGNVIPIRVLQVPDARRRDHIDTAFPTSDSRRP